MIISMFFQPERQNNFNNDIVFGKARKLMRFYDSMKVLGNVWHTNSTENKNAAENGGLQKTSFRLEVYCNDLVT
jgi:hypothetical protein